MVSAVRQAWHSRTLPPNMICSTLMGKENFMPPSPPASKGHNFDVKCINSCIYLYLWYHIEMIIMPYSLAIVKFSLFYEGTCWYTYKTRQCRGNGRAADLLFTVSCVFILSDYCPRFNTNTGSIDVHLCPVDSTCPRQHYLSSTVYKCKHTIK